jgi:hypothetical protein
MQERRGRKRGKTGCLFIDDEERKGRMTLGELLFESSSMRRQPPNDALHTLERKREVSQELKRRVKEEVRSGGTLKDGC